MGLRQRYLPLAGSWLLVVGVQLAASATDSAFYLTQLTMSAYYCLLDHRALPAHGLCRPDLPGPCRLLRHRRLPVRRPDHPRLCRATAAPCCMRTLERAGLLLHRQSLYGETLLSLHPWAACSSPSAWPA